MYASRPRPSLWLALCLLTLSCLAVAQPALGAGDDYPAEYRAGGTTTDRWGFAPRSYGSFISWRLEQRGVRVSAGGGWSDLIQSSRSIGELTTIASFAGARIDQIPEVGSIARWPANDPGWGPYGYAAWVVAVNPDGSIDTEDYDGNLRVILPDTFGSQGFLDHAPDWMAHWTGIRIDSGDPIEGGEMAIDWWIKRGQDPRSKLAIFSDGLDVDLISEIHRHFAGRIRMGFGWGTLLTNDFRDLATGGHLDPFSIVCKVLSADGRPAVKLSDNPTKAVGPADEIARYRRVFNVGQQEMQPVLV